MLCLHFPTLAMEKLLKTINTNGETIEQWAILDSGTTSHFLTTNAPALNILPTAMAIIAHLPNGERAHSTQTCTLNIASLLPSSRATHIIPGLVSHSLLSVTNLCNAGCNINFTKIGCLITYHCHTIVCGHKCTHTGLC